ncbi:MAG: hypothetical protein IMF02_09520, partial [Proteobacteria bacterium]|nr:hypothetical protein [Pseudomonadota bacterium]
AADRTLGKLVKWMRILGFDTICELEISSKSFFDNLEGTRILLTRTKKIQEKFSTYRTVFITSNFLVEQLKQVVNQIGINLADTRPFSRCIHCNLPIGEVNKDDVYGLVPDYIWETQETFNRCSHCERIYWPGSHAEHSQEVIKRIFKSV